MRPRNILLLIVALTCFGAGSLIYVGEAAARRGEAQKPSLEIVP